MPCTAFPLRVGVPGVTITCILWASERLLGWVSLKINRSQIKSRLRYSWVVPTLASGPHLAALDVQQPHSWILWPPHPYACRNWSMQHCKFKLFANTDHCHMSVRSLGLPALATCSGPWSTLRMPFLASQSSQATFLCHLRPTLLTPTAPLMKCRCEYIA